MKSIYEDISELLNKKIGESLEISKEINVKDLGDNRVKIKSPIFLEINFILSNQREVQADFKIEADLGLYCDRCLKEFNKKINSNFRQIYRTKKIRRQEDQEDNEEEIMPILPDQKVEIFEPMRQEILLTLPYKILCNEKCKGIKY
ncbi:MAG: DUF177 domain-containing protein [Patescibacteria group bacterium]